MQVAFKDQDGATALHGAEFANAIFGVTDSEGGFLSIAPVVMIGGEAALDLARAVKVLACEVAEVEFVH